MANPNTPSPSSDQPIDAKAILKKNLPKDPSTVSISVLEKFISEVDDAIKSEEKKNEGILKSISTEGIERELQIAGNFRLETLYYLLQKKRALEHDLYYRKLARSRARQVIASLAVTLGIGAASAVSYFVAKEGLAKELAQGRSDLEKKLRDSDAALGAKDRELSERDARLRKQAEDVAAKIQELDQKAKEAEARAKAEVESKQREVSDLTKRLEEAQRGGNRGEILQAVGNILEMFAAFDFPNKDKEITFQDPSSSTNNLRRGKVSDALNAIKEHFTPGGGQKECGLGGGPFSEARCGCFLVMASLKQNFPESFVNNEWTDGISSAPIFRISQAEAPDVRAAFEAIANLWNASGKSNGPRTFARKVLEVNGYDENGRKR